MRTIKRKTEKIKAFVVDMIEVRIPHGWEELTGVETWTMLHLLSHHNVSTDEVPMKAFLRLNDISVLGRNLAGKWLCRHNGKLFEITPEALARISAPMKFLLSAPKRPWRPETFGLYKPVAADLSETSFGDWLVIENIYQGVLATGNPELLDEIHDILMNSRRRIIFSRKRGRFTPSQRFAVLLWLRSVKDHMAARYPDFFTSVGADSSGIDSRMLEASVDAQIRALTKGDITKEDEIMGMNVYRALAELNVQAREYNEIKSKYCK